MIFADDVAYVGRRQPRRWRQRRRWRQQQTETTCGSTSRSHLPRGWKKCKIFGKREIFFGVKNRHTYQHLKTNFSGKSTSDRDQRNPKMLSVTPSETLRNLFLKFQHLQRVAISLQSNSSPDKNKQSGDNLGDGGRRVSGLLRRI